MSAGLKLIVPIFLPLLHKKGEKRKWRGKSSSFWQICIVDEASALIKNGGESIFSTTFENRNRTPATSNTSVSFAKLSLVYLRDIYT